MTVGSWNASGVHLLLCREGDESPRESRIQIGYNWHIGDGVIVKVLGILAGRIKLGFEAPKEIAIDRLEVRKAKLANNQAA